MTLLAVAGRSETTPQTTRTTALPPSVAGELDEAQRTAVIAWAQSIEARMAAPADPATLTAFVAASTATTLHEALTRPRVRSWCEWFARRWVGHPTEDTTR